MPKVRAFIGKRPKNVLWNVLYGVLKKNLKKRKKRSDGMNLVTKKNIGIFCFIVFMIAGILLRLPDSGFFIAISYGIGVPATLWIGEKWRKMEKNFHEP